MASILENNFTKRRNRSACSSEGSNTSPDAKKVKNLEGAESKENHEQDEILAALSIVDSVNDKLNDILSKLSSIEQTNSRMETTLKALESRLDKLESFEVNASEDLNDLKESLSFSQRQLEDMKGIQNENLETCKDHEYRIIHCEKMLEEYKTQNLYLEAYSRRENIKFLNIPEASSNRPRDSPENTEDALREFLEKDLGFADAMSVEIQRVHRLGKKKDGKPRPILARFLRSKDVPSIMAMGHRLRDTNYQMFVDLPYEIVQKRKAQLHILKKAKYNGIPANFSKAEPDKLYVRGKIWPKGKELVL